MPPKTCRQAFYGNDRFNNYSSSFINHNDTEGRGGGGGGGDRKGCGQDDGNQVAVE